MMMKKYGLITKVLLISMFAILLNGCENSLTSEFSSKANEAKFYTITGNIDVDAISAENSSRTGLPTIPSIDDNSINFSVFAKMGDETITGTVSGNQYSITLLKGSWTITVIGEKNEVNVLEGSITVNTEESTTQQTITLKTIKNEGTGSLYLTISKDATLSCGGVKATLYKNSGEESNDVKYLKFNDTDNNLIQLGFNDLPAGTYSIDLEFYQEMTSSTTTEGTYSCKNLLYSHHDTVNIFANLTTDTWTGSGYSEDKTTFTLTQAMINNFAMTTFYVDADGEDTNKGTYFKPFKTLQAAVNKVIEMNNVSSSSENAPYRILLLSDIEDTSTGEDIYDGSLISIKNHSNPELYLKIASYQNDSCFEIKGASGRRIMNIEEGANVTIENITLTGVTSGNINDNGGGVYVANKAIFTMGNGATISNCTGYNGGGVYVQSGIFIMNSGAKINGCKAEGEYAGGGVYLNGGTFTMNGGTISGCSAEQGGGGVCVQGGTFTMTGGTISENKADCGGGIYVADTKNAQGIVVCIGQLTIEGGEISGNSAEYGGGVAVDGLFFMSGGTISGNKVTNNSNGNGSGSGSGVYVAYIGNSQSAATFEMSGGAYVNSNNDVYLAKEASIKVTGNLTGTTPVATITPASYTEGTQVLVAGSGVNFTDKIINRFEVTQENDNEWYVTVNGNLQKIEKDDYGYLLGRKPKTETNNDGTAIYLMESYDNLLYIARELKTGSITSFNIKLTNDIEIPSSKWQFKQLNVDNASTIDGQGHSITINEDVSSFGNDAGGLFYKFNNSTVKNLVLNGRITAKTSITVNTTDNTTEVGYIGALCRSAYKTTIQNVMSTVEIIDEGSGNAGGLVGIFGGHNGDESTPDTFIKNCAVYADISSENGTAGGLVGESWANTQTWKIENCIYMGAVSSGIGFAGALIGNENTGRLSYLTNIWYCESNNRAIFGKEGNTGNIEQSGVESKTDDQIATADAARLLNTNSDGTSNVVWVEGEKYPTLKIVN